MAFNVVALSVVVLIMLLMPCHFAAELRRKCGEIGAAESFRPEGCGGMSRGPEKCSENGANQATGTFSAPAISASADLSVPRNVQSNPRGETLSHAKALANELTLAIEDLIFYKLKLETHGTPVSAMQYAAAFDRATRKIECIILMGGQSNAD